MVRLLFFGVLRVRAGLEAIDLAVETPLSVGELLDQAEWHLPGLRRWMEECAAAVAVNADLVDRAHAGAVVLRGGEEVALLPPFSGGAVSSQAESAVRFQTGPFSVDEETAAVKARSSRIGAVVAFLGAVRDLSHGRTVLCVEVETYPAMAHRQLERIRREAISTHALLAARMVVRHGRLEVGEELILILTAAEHRCEAFAAARWCIDEIKRLVPIWKRELTPEGWRWVEHGC